MREKQEVKTWNKNGGIGNGNGKKGWRWREGRGCKNEKPMS